MLFYLAAYLWREEKNVRDIVYRTRKCSGYMCYR